MYPHDIQAPEMLDETVLTYGSDIWSWYIFHHSQLCYVTHEINA
jgi:hypothetical protein